MNDKKEGIFFFSIQNMSPRFRNSGNQKTIFFGILITLTILTLLNESILSILDKSILINKMHTKSDNLGFDNIYVINLEFRTDRRERMEAIANFHGLDFEFFPAVSHDDYGILNEYPSPLFPRHKACYVSHYRVYESIVIHGYRSSLILEDDVDIELDIERILTNEVYPYLPEDWELLYIGNCDTGPTLNDSSTTERKYNLHASKLSTCTHAYALSLSGAQKLLTHLVNIDLPIDLYLMDIIEAGNITSYTLEPSAIVQWKSDDNPSDVSPGHFQWTTPLRNSTLHSCGYHERIISKDPMPK